MSDENAQQQHLPLHALHLELGARMVPFAGYAMPVQYPAGVMAEHLHCRAEAALFDVSHMGQVILRGPDMAAALERIMPVSVQDLPAGRQRYGFFTTQAGGIIDDLMLSNRGDHFFLVLNAANTAQDLAHLRASVPEGAVIHVTDRALLALQGPKAASVLSALLPGVAGMRFMDIADFSYHDAALWVARSGYTGEDGFEISVPLAVAEGFARALLADPAVAPAGLGARDSLRLEAGLCLHGNDIDRQTSPVEAGLTWAIQKARRTGGLRAGGFPGAQVILPQIEAGPEMLRVGLLPEGRAPMRAGVALFDTQEATAAVGRITSGGVGPSLGRPIAMGYVPAALAQQGTRIWAELRGKRLPVQVASLPFRPATYRK